MLLSVQVFCLALVDALLNQSIEVGCKRLSTIALDWGTSVLHC